MLSVRDHPITQQGLALIHNYFSQNSSNQTTNSGSDQVDICQNSSNHTRGVGTEIYNDIGKNTSYHKLGLALNHNDFS